MGNALSPSHLKLLERIVNSEEPVTILDLQEIKLASDLANQGLVIQKLEKEGQYIVPKYDKTNNGVKYLKLNPSQ